MYSEIYVRRSLPTDWSDWFGGLKITNLSNGDSMLAGELVDQTALLPIQAILVTLINDLSAVQEPIAPVLDDFQAVSSPAIHEGLAFLLDRLPPAMHLDMTTRTDPTLPLSRLRARNELLELRASDLQFSLPKTVQFVSGMIGVKLPDAGPRSGPGD